MPTFSANLGFLWKDRPLADAIRAAEAAGFAAVECHWPYSEPIDAVNDALAETGLAMLGINTRRGSDTDFGLAAIAGRELEARLAIDEAIRYAHATATAAIHVMAGIAPTTPDSFLAYLGNLRYACHNAASLGLTVLIEPLNPIDNPGYYLHHTADAAGVIEAVDRPNLKLMFDCYHVARTEGDVVGRLEALLPLIGHIQFASVPDRAEPDHGDLDYRAVFDRIDELGWTRPLGAEYRPTGSVEAGLSWMHTLSQPGPSTS